MQTALKISIKIAFIATSSLCCKQQLSQKPTELTDITDTTGITTQMLYIGTYTEDESNIQRKATGIYIYELDMTSGKLNFIGASPATTNPSYIDISPGGNWLYAVNETGSNVAGSSGSISAFRLIDHGKGLEFINKVSSAGNYPCYIQVDKSGKYVMTANYGSGTVAMFPIEANGSLGYAVAVDQHIGKGPTSRQESAHAHMIMVSRDNRFAYSCDLGTDRIYIYRLDTDNGKLVREGNDHITSPGSGPRHLALHPFKNFAYVANELNGTIACMKIDTLTGALDRFQTISTLAKGNGLQASCADIHITPSGNYLYATNRGQFNNIAMYSISSKTGELTLIGHQSSKGKTPRNFIIDRTGSYLLVANQDSDNVVTFRINPETGKLIDIGIEVYVPTPVCLRFLPEKPSN
jgi:6-phosphogluconolactonase